MAVTGLQKWPCPSCTYNNWSSSVKCVLCGCSRPNELTSRSSVVKYRPPVQGWSKLTHAQGSGGACLSPEIICADFKHHQSPSITSAADLHVQHHQQPPNHHHHHHKGTGHGVKCKTKGKWTCSSCTFSNWPNAGQCTMCGTMRSRGGQRNDPIISAGGRIETSSRSPVLSESILNYASGVGGAVGGESYNAGSAADEKVSSSLSQDLLFIQPSSARSKQNSRNGKRTSLQHQAENSNVKKWKCHQCTYENWPRAVKCVMCQSLRRRTPSPPFSGGEERDTPHAHLSAASSPSQQASSRLSPPSHLPPSLSTNSSPSPVHSRSGSNSNEALVTSQGRSSTDVSHTAASYDREKWSSLEIEPSTQLKSDSDEVTMLYVQS